MLFRFHANTLEESMKTCIEISDRNDLISFLKNKSTLFRNIKEEEIQCDPYGYDSRIGWRTYLITDKYGVIGMTNGKI